jgi:hypothetical protein
MNEISSVINTKEFRIIEKVVCRPNIFLALNNASFEIRHSNFLAWLLDPLQTHNLNKLFLNKLLVLINCGSVADVEMVKVQREYKNIDILITAKNFQIIVENKIATKDSIDQLKRYRLMFESSEKETYYIYLTPTGEGPTDVGETQYWKCVSYDQVIGLMRDCLDSDVDRSVALYLNDYIDAARLRLLPDSDLKQIARKFYLDNRKILDKVFNDYKMFENTKYKEVFKFIEGNSSHVRGVGFFSNDKPFIKNFEEFLLNQGYVIGERGKNQSTYLEFLPKSVLSRFETKLVPRHFPVSFSFRCSGIGLLEIKFSINPHPNKTVQCRYREFFKSKINVFHEIKIGTPVTRSGEKHIGVIGFKRDISQELADEDKLKDSIERLINNDYKPFVDAVTNKVHDLLTEFEVKNNTLS